MISLALLKSDAWRKFLSNKNYSKHLFEIDAFVQNESSKGNAIFPKENQIFEAFEICSLESVKVVILGQDPYHQPGQAHGLSFSVPLGVKAPPSLLNIYKEIRNDLGFNNEREGNLNKWALQGVLMINAIMTVNKNEAGSHRLSGWEKFTDQLIRDLSAEKTNILAASLSPGRAYQFL